MPASSATDNRNALPLPRTAALLMRFRAIWRDRWQRSIADVTTDDLLREWSRGLWGGFTSVQIEQACDSCRDTMAEPPTIAEFRRVLLDLRAGDAPVFREPAPRSDLSPEARERSDAARLEARAAMRLRRVRPVDAAESAGER